MNISVQTLLAKIEDELNSAKGCTKQEQLREKIYSIKILCELILQDQPNKSASAVTVMPSVPVQPVFSQPVYQQPSTIQQPKKIEMDDEANGDSLFDF